MEEFLNQNDLQTRFSDYYTYVDTLGQGAFGLVVKAVNNITKTQVAVKIISKSTIKRFEALEQEAAIFSQLNHQNIVKFYDIKRTDTKILIEMEIINGGSLQKLMDFKKKQNSWFEVKEIKQIIYGILSALSYIHENHFVHRDLKPDNILIGQEVYVVKITDFGLSSHHNRYALMQKKCGTLTYMAPELLLKKVYNKNVDVWSVGVIFYQLLNKGQHPYFNNGLNQEQLIKNMQNMHTEENFHNMDRQQISLFQRMTEFDSTKRYSAYQALLHPWINEKRQMIPQNFTEMFDLWLLTQKMILVIKGLMIIIHLKSNIRISEQRYLTLSNNQSKLTKTDVSDDNQDNSPYYQTSNLLNFLKIRQKIQKSKQSDYSSTNASPLIIKSIERQGNSNSDLLFLHSLVPGEKIEKESPEKNQKVQIKRLDSSSNQNTKNSSSNSPYKCNGNKIIKFLLKPLPTQNDLQKETQTVDLYKIQQKEFRYKQSGILESDSQGFSPFHTKTLSFHQSRTTKYKTDAQFRQKRIQSTIDQKKQENNLNYLKKR
ncbi:unnamed protein product [Paramecium primaurelia]|uniref:Protein kinase domain-containing protein n=1 Tax=Paramecium primaurelia TaxID=5886 RepID=A0A8S1L9X1_PARPR|nr:unnamed protein product [Paramecium primaurelia]